VKALPSNGGRPKLSPCGRLKVARTIIKLARRAVAGGNCVGATALMAMCFDELGTASRQAHRRFENGKGGCGPAAFKAAEDAVEGLSAALQACAVRKS
jgi:hypothetical protein